MIDYPTNYKSFNYDPSKNTLYGLSSKWRQHEKDLISLEVGLIDIWIKCTDEFKIEYAINENILNELLWNIIGQFKIVMGHDWGFKNIDVYILKFELKWKLFTFFDGSGLEVKRKYDDDD